MPASRSIHYGVLVVFSIAISLLQACQTGSHQQTITAIGEVSNSDLRWSSPEQFDRPPKLIRGPQPAYPISQVRAGNPGFAVIAFTIDTEGKTRNLRVVRASYPYFGSHALIPVRDWKFEPALKNGHPVPVRTEFDFEFRPVAPDQSDIVKLDRQRQQHP